MKILLIGLLSFSCSFAAATTFKCQPPKKDANAFFADGYALISLEDNEARVQHYDTASGKEVLLRDYKYASKGIKTGTSKVAGMRTYALTKEVKSHGDSIRTIYLSPEMKSGKNGVLMFTGHGFSWDWNYCRAVEASTPQAKEPVDLCRKAVVTETLKLSKERKKADPDFAFNGIGDIWQEDEETYKVTFGYNEECQGGFEFVTSKSDDGKSCKVTKSIEMDGECG